MGASHLLQQTHARARRLRCRNVSEAPLASTALIEEDAGMHVGISADLREAARHAAVNFHSKYQEWREHGRHAAWGDYKRKHFAVAVGGGNTLKAQLKVMVEQWHSEIDWVQHVRFFFLEESSGEAGWESAEQSLITNFIEPVTRKLIKLRGRRALARDIKLKGDLDDKAIIDQVVARLVNPINMAEVKRDLNAGKRSRALQRARAEASRYQREIEHSLGSTMGFHYIMSGIGKNGTVGALAPYTPELGIKEPGILVLKQGKKALRIAMNRGVLVNSDCISLIVSGNLKLRALGRFEMEESTDFEQTVMETPLRMLRETREIARKVYIFADEQSLHFEETSFKYTEQGQVMYNKAETREGEEAKGPHVLLLHGFMGLFSFTSFLVRLPSAWKVSALHRGSHAKTLAKEEIFPHYANVLRQVILQQWRKGRPTPIAGHSIAGVISDHLLLSILNDYEAPIVPYEKLKGNDKNLVDALRASGIVHLATWAPSDGLHAGENIKSAVSHYRSNTELDYAGFDRVYRRIEGQLQTTESASVAPENSLAGLDRFLNFRLAEPLINSLNFIIRTMLNNKTVQQGMLNTNSPYVLRLVGNRLLKTASFYGLCKEINAAMHDPVEYQRRHLKALDVIAEYDIPFLCIVHEDDFLVSARRHREEHNYLLARRKQKEAVSGEAQLKVPVRYLELKRAATELPVDPLNPHLMIIATSQEANQLARQITAAITRFVNENLERACRKRQIKSIPSVRKWMRENGDGRKRGKAKVA